MPNRTTIRVARRDRFTIVDRQTCEDAALSFRARGVLLWLLSKPDGWTTDADKIAREGTEGRDAVRSALRELSAQGYLQRTTRRCEDGTVITETVVYERPPATGNPLPEPATGNPPSDNQEAKELRLIPKTHVGTSSKTANNKQKDPSAGTDYSRGFLEVWAALPPKTTSSKKAAAKAYSARIREGVTHRTLLVAARTYARERDGQAPSFTMQAQTFLGPNERWKPWADGLTTAEVQDDGTPESWT